MTDLDTILTIQELRELCKKTRRYTKQQRDFAKVQNCERYIKLYKEKADREESREKMIKEHKQK